MRLFYGWRVVGVCFAVAMLTWGFAVYGASVYLGAITGSRGWTVSFVSGGVTCFYITNALFLPVIGSVLDRFGPRFVFIGGALALGCGVALMGEVVAPWQLYGAFAVIGLGYAALSITGITSAISPWFERHLGRSIAIALTGASFGAILVVPLLVMAVDRFGFSLATLGGGCLIVAVLVPLAGIVLRYRDPAELGLAPDGVPRVPQAVATQHPAAWTRAAAMRTAAFWSVAISFALGLTVQVGFFTHQLEFATPLLGLTGAGWLVGATGLANLCGRLLLVHIADRIVLRRYTAAILIMQALVLAALAWQMTAQVMIAASLIYGFCLGQMTTLSPILVRQEFGAASFGAIYSAAATVIQFSSALGPAAYGLLRDILGGYQPVLGIAAAVEAVAMVIVLAGWQRGLRPP